jgi:hypothetical protein
VKTEADHGAPVRARPACATCAGGPFEVRSEQLQRLLGARGVELFVFALDDCAPPAARAVVLVHLEAHPRVLPHHPDLLALDGRHVDVVAGAGVDHGDDVREAVSMTADPAHDVASQQLIDLVLGQLLHHREDQSVRRGPLPIRQGAPAA